MCGFWIRTHALKQNNALLFGICVYNKKIYYTFIKVKNITIVQWYKHDIIMPKDYWC